MWRHQLHPGAQHLGWVMPLPTPTPCHGDESRSSAMGDSSLVDGLVAVVVTDKGKERERVEVLS